MYCKVCGQDGPGDRDSCVYCGAPLDSKIIISSSEFEPDTVNVGPAIRQESQTNFPRFLWISCVVLVAVLGILLFLPGFRGMVVRNITSPVGLMERVYCQSVVDVVSHAYSGETIPAGDNMSVQYQANIGLGEDVLSLLADAIEVDPQDIQGLSDIQITCDAAYENYLLMALYNVELNKQEIVSFEQYVDSQQMMQWILFPELCDQALLVDMSKKTTFSDIFDTDSHTLAQIDPNTLEKVTAYYTRMLIQGFENVNKSKETLTCNGFSQRMTVLKATISSEQLCHTLIAILDDASHNPDVLHIISDLQSQLGQTYYEDFLETLDREKIKLQKILQQSDYREFTLHTYLNQSNDIVGIRLEYADAGALYQVFSYITVKKGMQYATEISFWNGFSIQGCGTAGKGINGTFAVYHTDKLICDIQITNLSYSTEGISGSVKIFPNEEIVEHLVDQMNAYEAYLRAGRLPGFSVEMDLIWNSDYKNLSISFYTDNELLGNARISVELKDLPTITLPQNFIDSPCISDAESWWLGIDETAVDALIDRLVGAGMSRELFEYLSITDNGT